MLEKLTSAPLERALIEDVGGLTLAPTGWRKQLLVTSGRGRATRYSLAPGYEQSAPSSEQSSEQSAASSEQRAPGGAS